MTVVFETMGTVASLDSERPLNPRVEAIFDDFDRLFSLYRPDSELSRIAGRVLDLVDADSRVRDAYALAHSWSGLTNGAFTAHRPDGVLDLSGIVKALAMDAAGRELGTGDESWVLAVGGDVLASEAVVGATGGTRVSPSRRIGITDPLDRGRLLTAVTLAGSRRAVATSGSTERGDHIWGAARAAFRQVTVIADDIVTADVLATAIVAGGVEALNASTSAWDIDVLAVDAEGGLFATPGFTAVVHA